MGLLAEFPVTLALTAVLLYVGVLVALMVAKATQSSGGRN
jgi:hypothetical protein